MIPFSFSPLSRRVLLPALCGTSLLGSITGCSVFHRSHDATNVEHEASEREDSETTQTIKELDTTPPPQKTQGAAQAHQLNEAGALFKQASREQEEGAFLKASELWKKFLELYTGLPGYNRATYNYGVSLFTLGRAADAIPFLKSLIQEQNDPVISNDARILLAESLMQTQSLEEALAVTFEVLPNNASERDAGIYRDTDAIGVAAHGAPGLTQKIRLYTIRGRIYAALGNDQAAHAALERAKLLLMHAPQGAISSKEFQFLSSNYAWRQIEVLARACQRRAALPVRLSEDEFLAYADTYYSCAQPAQQLYCTVLAARNEQVRVQAQKTYRALVEEPLRLRDNLPPPARTIKKPEQRSYYEHEMKSLIEKTVDERSKEFRDIDACNAKSVF